MSRITLYRGGMDRVAEARSLAKLELAIAITAVLLTFILVAFASPTFFGPPPPPISRLPGLIGFIGTGVGLVWMMRIYLAHPEPDQHHWRYHR